jgi:inhibitor of cysteine peptidase
MSSLLVVTQEGNGKTIDLSVGQVFLIQLDENPTTGYRWDVCEIDPDLIERTEDQYSQNLGSETGGGGVRIFKFTAKKTGQSQIQLKHWRSWEGHKSTIGCFTIQLRVL